MKCGKKKCDGWGEHHPDNCIVGDKYVTTTCAQFKPLKGKTEPVAKSPAAMAGSATLTGFTKEEIKEMVDSVYGSCEWVLTNRGESVALVCYPNANGEVVIHGE